MTQQNPTTYMRERGGRAEAEVLLQVIVVSIMITVPFAFAIVGVQAWYSWSQPKED